MSPILIAGTIIVNFALLAYTIAIVIEQRKRLINNQVLTFLTTGVLLDITATICMIAGSTHSAITLHGMLGYSALLAMLVDCILLWRHRQTQGAEAQVARTLHLYSRYAYIWWIAAYITGAVLVAVRHMA